MLHNWISGELEINTVNHVMKSGEYYQLSHGCQGDTEKYLTQGNLYHPRHTCITRDVVEGNTGVSRVIQMIPKKLQAPANFLYRQINSIILNVIDGFDIFLFYFSCPKFLDLSL